MIFAGWDILRFVIPFVVGFGTGWICPLQNAGDDVPATPPGWVFGLVWTFLYGLMGITWIFASRLGKLYDLAFSVLVVMLAAWVVAFGCRGNKRAALYIIFLCILVSLSITVSLAAKGSQWCIAMVPLIVWLVLASMLNFTIVNK